MNKKLSHEEQEKIAKDAEAGYAKTAKQMLEANQIKFEITKMYSEALGRLHESVFVALYPEVSEDARKLLFADVRAAQDKAVKKKGK